MYPGPSHPKKTRAVVPHHPYQVPNKYGVANNDPQLPNEPKNAKIYIGGLPPCVTYEDLFSEFCEYGHITKIWIARKPPGFAYLYYPSMKEAKRAVMARNNTVICRNLCKVELSYDEFAMGNFTGDITDMTPALHAMIKKQNKALKWGQPAPVGYQQLQQPVGYFPAYPQLTAPPASAPPVETPYSHPPGPSSLVPFQAAMGGTVPGMPNNMALVQAMMQMNEMYQKAQAHAQPPPPQAAATPAPNNNPVPQQQQQSLYELLEANNPAHHYPSSQRPRESRSPSPPPRITEPSRTPTPE
ncbi:unnamed protein product, partial [Mesorhabditis spiculigera]